ncbi:MAG TPA: hypothetical protein VIV88_07155 [Gemmatimonadales bacterium]
MLRFPSAVCLVVGLSPAVASSQGVTPDTTPFHRGQWAAQFGAGTSFASLGFLKFTAPTRAWLLDFHLSGGHSHSTAHNGDSLLADGYTSNATGNTRVGRRFYQARSRVVASFQTVGLLGGYAHLCEGNLRLLSFCDNGWNAGAFGEFGGVYLVSPRLSLGGAATAAFMYERSQGHDNLGNRETHWEYGGAFQGLSFTATVYF